MSNLNPESVARALIAQSEGMGPNTMKGLSRACDGTMKVLFENPDDVYRIDVQGMGKKRKKELCENLERWDLESARDRLTQKNIGVISPEDEPYPENLAEIYDPPPVLFYRGRPRSLQGTRLAIVGTRKASELGKDFAQKLARELAEVGITIVSGLASGIDAAAHRGALNASETSTVSVLGNGVDVTYPQRNRKLQEEIEQSCLTVSEYSPGTPPDGRHFPERNRIISGLSSAVVVVQAGVRSGAIITADSALEQGREVYAVPGNVNDELHKGCHRLIKEGAGLVETAEDVIDYLQVDGTYSPPMQTVKINSEAQSLFEKIQSRPVHLDELVEKTDFDHGTCSRLVLELENKGLVLGLPGQRYQRSPDACQVSVEEPQ